MNPELSPGRKATVVFCALFAGTGFVALAVFGASGVVPALAGSLIIAGPFALTAYVVLLRSEDRQLEEDSHEHPHQS
jgi:1,4-dihydroxy-2-naphthoate octaprenyltransferase